MAVLRPLRAREADAAARLAVLGLAGLGVWFAAILRSGAAQPGVAWTPLLLGLLPLTIAAIRYEFSGPSRIARADVTRDGLALRLREVAPEFVAALPPTARRNDDCS